MKFKVTQNLKLRSSPRLDASEVCIIPAGAVVESDGFVWKFVTLSDGKSGYCAASYLQPLPEATIIVNGSKWSVPIRGDKFKVTQKFLNPDSKNYSKTGHHPGTDYGTQGEDNVPLYYCTDGEVIESGNMHKYFGNYFFYYIPEADRTFAYFHLRDNAPTKGQYKAGEHCGITGKTGLSYGIHLHLECMLGRKTSTDRARMFNSKEKLFESAEDADLFIRLRLKK